MRGVATTHYRATMDLADALEQAPADQREQLEAAFEQLGDVGEPAASRSTSGSTATTCPRRMQIDMGRCSAPSALGDAR